MASRKGKRNRTTLEFYEYYDQLCIKYSDPLETLFDLQSDILLPEAIRTTAAKELIGYRHAKRRSIEVVETEKPIGIDIDKDDADL